MKNISVKVFLYYVIIMLIGLNIISAPLHTSYQKTSLFIGSMALFGVCKLYNLFESYGPYGSEMKVRKYLHDKLQIKVPTHQVNISYAARLVGTGNLLKPYTFYDNVIQSAILLAEQEQSAQLEVKHFVKAMNKIDIGDFKDTLDTDYKFKIAIHESGHVIATLLLLQECSVVHQVIVGDLKNGSGATLKLPVAANFQKFNDEQNRSKIIEKMAGGVAEQVFDALQPLSENTLPNLYNRTTTQDDMVLALKYARQMAILQMPDTSFISIFKTVFNVFTQEEQDWINTRAWDILYDCYDETYNLIINNKDKIKILSDKIFKDSIVDEDDIYDLLNIDKPLYDFQEGPLPESLVKNYALRGYELHDVDQS